MRGLPRGVASPEFAGLLREGVAANLTDRELLARFASSRGRDGDLAFTVLVARHGPMVLGICRRILRDPADADDAFQATFLVLVRRAGSIRLESSLGPWLHGVSVRVARRLRAVAARQGALLRNKESIEAVPDRRPDLFSEQDTRMAIAEALEELPAAFRAALVLCYLEGLTHEEAADRLGCPVGTVRSRLARGRELLRTRLETSHTRSTTREPGPAHRAGIGSAPPILAPCLIQSTARAAARLAAGHSMAGVVPARVAEVATGVVAAMFRTKLAAVALVVTILTVAGWGAWGGQSVPGQDASGSSPQAIDKPPSDRLRGDFDTPKQKRMLPSRTEQDDKPAAELPADFPAFVVETQPKLGDTDVDPATIKEIRVTFSKPMIDKSWSWTSGNVYAFPESTGPIRYLADKRTCVMPVKLEPGKTYVIGINGGRFHNFKDTDGRPALDYTIGFRTRAAK